MTYRVPEIADRAGDNGKDQRISDSYEEHIVLQKQFDIILNADQSRPFQHVEIGKAENDRNPDRQNDEYAEQKEERQDHRIAGTVLVHSYADRLFRPHVDGSFHFFLSNCCRFRKSSLLIRTL